MSFTEEQKNTAGMKMALDAGIEFTSRLSYPGWWFVGFRDAETSHAVRDQLQADGFLVEVCPNQSWLRVCHEDQVVHATWDGRAVCTQTYGGRMVSPKHNPRLVTCIACRDALEL